MGARARCCTPAPERASNKAHSREMVHESQISAQCAADAEMRPDRRREQGRATTRRLLRKCCCPRASALVPQRIHTPHTSPYITSRPAAATAPRFASAVLFDRSQHAKMSDKSCTLRTRKFITNGLLSRKQFVSGARRGGGSSLRVAA
eukprot:363396-Chlamydomonas_euryale.AAC.2